MEKIEQYNKEKEEQIRTLWRINGIVEKARNQNSHEKCFYLMDGPPYASGHIHMGTALNKIIKDITIRQKRMQGYTVLDQPGYDTHGLPIEKKVEEKLGLKDKSEIEKIGEEKFIDECKKFATEFIEIMNEEFDNLGVWMDWENPYLTLDKEYIEGLWWTFKKAEEKGLLYLGSYPVHASPSSGTVVAYNEIEYEKVTDTAIYVKFPMEEKGKFLIIWTTTPWTLPSNTGVMVHPEFEYVEAEVMGETWIIAKERLEKFMEALEAGFTIKKEFKGKELEGKKYENPLAKNLTLEQRENGYRVILSERYVNVEEGTGLVHTAPGCGKEDYDAGTKAGLPIINITGIDGTLNEEAGKYAGKKAREVDKEIIRDLESENMLPYKHPYTHDYPVDWRTKKPLIMISVPQWFFKVTSIQKRMIELNEKVNWVPAWGKDRFRNWLENLGDWPISRQRYWGTPLPIWICDKCEKREVIGSSKELKEKTGKEVKELHKPWIDGVKWECECGGSMKRVPDVLDVWFDSGATSWGSIKYPAEKEKFEKYWPADINIEGKDQIRGWWNSQLITSTICFDKAPFKTIAMHGMILDLGKKKMSKSLGNIVSPKEVIEKYNRDYLRYYLAKEFRGEDMMFDWNYFKDINRFFNTLWNSFNYGATYLEMQNSEMELEKAEDKWIISKLNSLIKEVTENYNSYNYGKAVSAIEYFMLEEFSRTYIKIIRERVKEDKEVLGKVFGKIFSTVIRMLAPITPHISEHYYQNMEKGESVHLTQMPKKGEIDTDLEKEMAEAKEIIQTAMSLREEQKLRLRWPLEEMIFENEKEKFPNTKEIIANQANVKKFIEGKGKEGYATKKFGKGKIYLRTEAGKELKEEWELMELRRRIQDKRKQAKLNPNDKVEVEIDASDKEFLEKYKEELEESTNTKIVEGKGEKEKLLEREFYIKIR